MKLTLKNFQGHSDSVVEICDGINVIVGDSDVGKSSIARAMLWLVMNKPSWKAIRKNGEKEVSVSLVLDNGTKITRRASPSDNVYVLNKKEFRSFKTGVPEEVSKALNMSEFNFHSQHDGFFFLSETGGQRAKLLGKFLDLKSMLKATELSASKCREINAEYKALGKLEEELKESLSVKRTYNPKEVLSECKKCEALECSISDGQRLLGQYAEIRQLRKDLNATKKRSERLSDGLKVAKGKVAAYRHLQAAQSNIEAVVKLRKRLSELKDSLKQCKKEIKKLNVKRCKECGAILTGRKKL